MKTEDLDRFWDEVGRIGTCMVVSSEGDTMAVPAVGVPDPALTAIWLPIGDLAGGPLTAGAVRLTYADIGRQVFVAVNGSASAGHALQEISGEVRSALPKQQASLNYEGLIKVTPASARLWKQRDIGVLEAMANLTAVDSEHGTVEGTFIRFEPES